MEHTKHIWRAVFLLIGAVIVAVVARHFMIPRSFGDKGFYRYDSLGEHRSKPPIHGAVDACGACHQPAFDAKKTGKHVSVSCEVCHGPLSDHVKDNAKIAKAPVDKSYTLCLRCHEKLKARPETFPQVEPTEHLIAEGAIATGEPIPEEACIACHDVHSP